MFVVQVTVGDQIFDPGKGHSKKLAKKQAALIAMNELFGLEAKIGKINFRHLNLINIGNFLCTFCMHLDLYRCMPMHLLKHEFVFNK